MGGSLQPARRVHRQIQRRLPKELRTVRRSGWKLWAATAALAIAALAVLRWLAPAGPLQPDGAMQRDGALSQRPAKLVFEGAWLYPATEPATELWLEVPRDDARARPRHHLHAVRIAAGDETVATAIPTLLIDDGAQPIAARLAGARRGLLSRLRAAGPVIAVDLRGSAGSDPDGRCPGLWTHPLAQPLSEASLREAMAPHVARCVSERGAEYAAGELDDVRAADDLERLREALGIARWRVLGVGAGADVAERYLARHPARVARAALVAPPSRAWPEPEQVESVLQRAAAAIAQVPVLASALPELRESLRVAIARAEQEPIALPPPPGGSEPLRVSGDDLRLAAIDALGETDARDRFADVARAMVQGDHRALAPRLRALRSGRDVARRLALECGAAPDDDEMHARRLRAAFTVLGDPVALRRAGCAQWSRDGTAPVAVSPAGDNPVPVRIYAGGLDVRAPLEDVERRVASLPGASLRQYDARGGADDLLADPQLLTDLDRWLQAAPASAAPAAATH